MWGSDYPHDEGTHPYTTESLRRSFAGTDPDELQQLLAGNAARVYGFDLDALAPIAARVGPTVDEVAVPLDTVPADSEQPRVHAPVAEDARPRAAHRPARRRQLLRRRPVPAVRPPPRQAPVAWNDTKGFWAVSRWDDVMAVSTEPETFCSGAGSSSWRSAPTYDSRRR